MRARSGLTVAVAREDKVTKVNDLVKVLWLHAVRWCLRATTL